MAPKCNDQSVDCGLQLYRGHLWQLGLEHIDFIQEENDRRP